MTEISPELLAMFPPLPEHEGVWYAVYVEPVMCSGERLTVGIIACDKDGAGCLKTLSPERLESLFGSQATGMASMIDMALDAALKAVSGGTLDSFKFPLSGFFLSEARTANGDNRDDILQLGATLSSAFFERPA